MHEKIKKVVGKYHKRHISLLRDTNNPILEGPEENLQYRKDYVYNFFYDNKPNQILLAKDINETSPVVNKDEVRHVIKIQKDGKAVVTDGVHGKH